MSIDTFYEILRKRFALNVPQFNNILSNSDAYVVGHTILNAIVETPIDECANYLDIWVECDGRYDSLKRACWNMFMESCHYSKSDCDCDGERNSQSRLLYRHKYANRIIRLKFLQVPFDEYLYVLGLNIFQTWYRPDEGLKAVDLDSIKSGTYYWVSKRARKLYERNDTAIEEIALRLGFRT
jgi:hypothetical protein